MQELVLPSLSVLEDPQFTALSVTAHHWLKISEVSPAHPMCFASIAVLTSNHELTSSPCAVFRYVFPSCPPTCWPSVRRAIGWSGQSRRHTASPSPPTPSNPALSYCWGGYAVLPISHTLHSALGTMPQFLMSCYHMSLHSNTD